MKEGAKVQTVMSESENQQQKLNKQQQKLACTPDKSALYLHGQIFFTTTTYILL